MDQTLELEPLLLTKLYAPRLDASCLHRSALLDTLGAGCMRSVTLVSAPAGYGKSTLVADWLAQGDMPWCWLSLDESDSDLRNFLRYLIAAVQAEIPDFCVEFQDGLAAFEAPTVDEAFRHYLKSGSSDLAKATILKHQRVAFETEQVYRVLEWLELVGEIATRDPELLLARAWLSERAGRYAEVKEIVSRVETLLDEGAGVASAEIPRLRGECHTLSSGLAYLDVNPDESIFHAERALELLPDGEASLGFAAMIKLVALQMKGEGVHARSFGRELLERNKFDAGAPRGRFLQGLCYLYWLSGDLKSLGRMAESLNEFSTDEGMPESVAYANYFRGLYSYHVDDLETARAVLEGLAVNERMVNYQIATNATCLLANVYSALDKPREAEAVLDSAIKENLVASATVSLAMARACRAELALRRGAIEEAVQWADKLEAGPLTPAFRSVMPELVYLQVRMQQDTPESRAEVDELLATYEDFLRKTHTIPFLIKLLVLKALWEARRGDEHGALQALEEPVMLAFVGGVIRTLSGSDRVNGEPPPTAAGPEQQTEIRVNGNVLSKREQQILQLLAERLGNAEIGERLFISPATVKCHAQNIYEKLGVHGRREAVVKARGLGLLR